MQAVNGLGAILGRNAREGFRSLYSARLRSTLALAGIVIGVGSVITMISIGEVARATARAEFESQGTDILTIQNVHGSSTAPGRSIDLKDALLFPAAVESIVDAAPRIGLHGSIVYAGKQIGPGPIHGVTESFVRVNRLALEEGRFVSDLDRRRYFCVLGAEVARAMRRAGAERIVGKSIVMKGRLFTVTGVLREAADNYALPFQVEADRSVFIPITTAQWIRPDTGIDVIVARARPDFHHTAVAQDVRAWFGGRSGNLELEITSATQLIEQMESQIRIMTLLLGAIGSVSLIVGGIGVMNVMLVSVTERRREIGVRRALGARRLDILNQFLMEAAILSAAGGILGVAAGMAGTWTICHFTEWSFFISTNAMVSGICVSSLVGIAFGLQPANQASRVDPIMALQGE